MHSMQTRTFKINGRSTLLAGEDWHARLVGLLGHKPRRLSRWCELGLFGALTCIRQAGHAALPNDVAIRVSTEYGTLTATRSAMAQANDHLPMPFAFLQTQPGQLFNALGMALDWHGDAHTTSCSNRAQNEIAMLQGIKQSALLARVDDSPEPISHWLWLDKVADTTELHWRPVDSIFQLADTARWLTIDGDNTIFQAS